MSTSKGIPWNVCRLHFVAQTIAARSSSEILRGSAEVVKGGAVSILLFVCLFFCFLFGVAQEFKRRFFCGICYFSVFLHPIMLRFRGSNILQRGDYVREICYFVIVHASPFPLQPVRAVSILFFVFLFFCFFFGVAQALKR